mmetsp:Transcript_56165/g.119565  ORF Transcript_56165/g.119565 Transcript_56165/m.119565 type:complete len:86 (+) Transcript_56165:573-830(+)
MRWRGLVLLHGCTVSWPQSILPLLMGSYSFTTSDVLNQMCALKLQPIFGLDLQTCGGVPMARRVPSCMGAGIGVFNEFMSKALQR